jgi:hypothetical protein
MKASLKPINAELRLKEIWGKTTVAASTPVGQASIHLQTPVCVLDGHAPLFCMSMQLMKLVFGRRPFTLGHVAPPAVSKA